MEDSHVLDFLDWAIPLVRGERPLRQSWDSPRLGSWSCETLLGACLRYDWPFRCTLPGDLHPRQGRTYLATVVLLDELAGQLRDSANNNQANRFHKAAIAVVKWGGVPKKRLDELGNGALPRLTAAKELLDPAQADLSLLAGAPMNSGFSKIYSLLIDGFPIYDSRVACALASLVRLFCEETGRTKVPARLEFALPPAHGDPKRRDPSSQRLGLVFPKTGSKDEVHAKSNVMAAWLLGALAEKPPFSALGAEGVRAIQFAMFMIGYTAYSEPKRIRRKKRIRNRPIKRRRHLRTGEGSE